MDPWSGHRRWSWHDREGCAAAHEVAPVGPSGVVVLEPALELGVEVGEAGEVLAVEGRAVELLQRGALEPLADGVVVGRAGRDAMVAHAADAKMLGEGLGGELWTVVAQHRGQFRPDLGQAFGDVVDKGGSVSGRLVPGDQPGDHIAGGGVDRGELPDRPDAFELADIEGIQSDQIAGSGGEVAEPKGPSLAWVVRMPVVVAVSWARAATRWARRPSRWRRRIFCTPDGDKRTPRSAR